MIYKQLKIDLPATWYFRYKCRSLTGRMQVRFPAFSEKLRSISRWFSGRGRAADKIAQAFDRWSYYGAETLENEHFRGLLHQNQGESQSIGSGYGYETDDREVDVARHYRQQLLDKENGVEQKTESFELYDKAISTVAKILSENSSCTDVVNFGVSYAHIDSQLAQMFPDRRFMGVDRSLRTIEFNREFFSSVENLEFMADDIFEYLQQHCRANSVLMHSRILTLLAPATVEELYRACASAGIKYIAGFEVTGVSRETNRPYDFTDQSKQSVHYRNTMFIHNYPGLLREAGYNLNDCGLLKTSHPEEDNRIIWYVASLVGK